MPKQGPHQAQDHEFQEVQAVETPAGQNLELDDLMQVKLVISADLGTSQMSVRDLVDLKEGSIVPLSKLAGELTDVLLNELPLARGEIVVIGDSLHVRITEIIGVSDVTS